MQLLELVLFPFVYNVNYVAARLVEEALRFWGEGL